MSEKEEDSFFTVGIHGLPIVGNTKATLSRRTLWLLAILATLGLTLWYWVDRTSFLISIPLQTSITVLEMQSLVMPDVTICTRHRFNMTKLYSMWKSLSGRSDFPNDTDFEILDFVDQATYWEATAYDFEGLIVDCKYMLKHDCRSLEWWTPRMTSFGKCFTLRGPEVSVSGGKFGLKISLNETKRFFDYRQGFMPVRRGWQIAIHPHNVPPDMILMESGFGKLVRQENYNGRKMDISEISRIAGSVSQFERMNLGDGSCVADENYTYEGCKVLCWQRAVLQACGCRMSFMDLVDGPPCRTKAQNLLVADFLDKIYYNGIWSPSSCNCPKQCTELVYSLSIDTISVRSPLGTGLGRLWISYQQMTPTMTEVEEDPAYDFDEWFGDIGGVSNFMMGMSVLTLVKMIDVFCVKIFAYVGRKWPSS